MKKIDFQKICSLPDIEFSVEQHEITIKDVLDGNFNVGSPRQDYTDAEDETLDDFDDMCNLYNEVDSDFEQRVIDEMREEDQNYES